MTSKPDSTGSAHTGGAQGVLSSSGPRLSVLTLQHDDASARMRAEIAAGLASQPRCIPPTYFYDAVGSALYEQITQLDAYYPTRTEASLLRRLAPQLARALGNPEIVELGSGSSRKTRLLLDAFAAHGQTLTYVPIDVNQAMLLETAECLVKEYPNLRVMGLAGQFEEALDVLPPSSQRLVLFLGGTIGNFTPTFQEAFIERLAKSMAPDSHLLLGFDRRPHARKPERRIHAAYNDARGLTARFNLNLLERLNRELGADFRHGAWLHRALYNPVEHQIEMYLESRVAQEVRLEGLGLAVSFEAQERILTEISRKFNPSELAGWFEDRGFRAVEHWSDERQDFSVMLFKREG